MATQVVHEVADGVCRVGAMNGPGDYVLWQAVEGATRNIHFEFNDRANGGYDIVLRCEIDFDAVKITLADHRVIEFRIKGLDNPVWVDWVNGLESIYPSGSGVLSVCGDDGPPK
ncbi:MAG: hypothetical protein R3236_02270 [Phycisphaeraceae bacterium]|nr:hypothetical protein [Phycisphaeraceae bacterium]